jgi:APA family basic amino acid/polyamine antiporter
MGQFMNGAGNGEIRKIGLVTTSAFVIANMVGTGVFTSLGFQLNGINNIIAVLALWVIGGVIALCGALVYSELGAAMPRSGGEYHYLSKIYHPWLGFLSGWVSITVGFAAPVAIAAMALGNYSSKIMGLSPEVIAISVKVIAISVLVILTVVHSYDIKLGSNFQTIFTSFNMLLIIVFILCGFLLVPQHQNITIAFKSFSWMEFLKRDYAKSLIFVCYAFSGWNASAYIASEIKNPQKMIPRSLFVSTILVTVLYFFINFIFLYTSPVQELKGQIDVGYISAIHIFGATGGRIIAVLISLLLISSISSMIFIGPRVSQVMGEDMTLLKFLSIKSKRSTPMYAILIQFTISFILIITASFEGVLIYAGFTLNLFTFLTVLGVFIHRKKYKEIERPYKTWGYPIIPIIFLSIMLWTLTYLMLDRPLESLMGFATVLSGSVLYYINYVFEKKSKIVKVESK